MRIGIITLHHVRNQGSLLQTYALQLYLEAKGFECEVIDYVPAGLTLRTGILTIKKNGSFLVDMARTLCAAAAFSSQQAIVNLFLKKHIHLSRKRYHNYEELALDPPYADVYISGSDQIWNTQNANEADDLKGYYLCFAPEGKPKVSYASSIGKDGFEAEESRIARKSLETYKAISVREKQAVGVLNGIGLKNVVHVVDPTLLLSKEDWREFCAIRRTPRHRYIFVYNLNRNQNIKEMAIALANRDNLKIVNFADTLDFIKGAKNKLFNSPHDFLYYLDNAKYVLTDSFHGTVFSINYGKQFVTFPAPRFNSRIESVLEQFGLKDRLWREEYGTDISELPPSIDYQLIATRVESERERSRQWLLNAIEE